MANRKTAARPGVVLAVLSAGVLMITVDITAVNVALSSIQRDLNFSQAELAWVIDAYLITFGGFLLVAGRLGDLVGRKKVFLSGLGIFTAASLVCGLAQNPTMLIAARFIQGLGGALALSVILGIIATLYPKPAERATAFGLYSFVNAAGGSVGLLASGAVTQALNWHWIFFLNLPVCVATVLLGAVLINENQTTGHRPPIDAIGAVLITAALTLGVYSIVNAGSAGWTSNSTLIAGVGALILLASFVTVELRTRFPLVPLRLLRSRTVTTSNLIRGVMTVGTLGSFFIQALYLQRVLGYGTFRTGIAFLPVTLMTSFLAIAATARLMRSFGAKATLIPGLVFATLGIFLFAREPVNGSYLTDVLPGMLLLGTGTGLAFTPLLALAMSESTPSDSGLASGMINVSQQIGGALGLAVIASAAATRTNHLLTHGIPVLSAEASGYQLASAIAAVCVGTTIALATVLLHDNRPASEVILEENSIAFSDSA